MFICGYHFPASEGNKIGFDKVVEKVTAGAGDISTYSKIEFVSETREGKEIERFSADDKGTFLFTAFVDYYTKSDIEGEYKMVFYTNKYQISEVSKAVDGAKTAEICRKLDDMNLYRIKVS
ncbi:MAG: hypothetical protein LBQ18_02745 [Campylobacteraceae bacterium]|jgi:hypothetical protein|nr:hypothetical protein [Campylobacteraceae bacterium]